MPQPKFGTFYVDNSDLYAEVGITTGSAGWHGKVTPEDVPKWNAVNGHDGRIVVEELNEPIPVPAPNWSVTAEDGLLIDAQTDFTGLDYIDNAEE